MEKLNTTQLNAMLLDLSGRMIRHKDLLCEIDGKIGDGDHGLGIERGFTAVMEILEGKEFDTVNALLSETGMAMQRSMGGASGIIFSAMFLGLCKQPDAAHFTPELLHIMCREGLSTIKKHGKAKCGDKTMIDALEPAVSAMERALPSADLADFLDRATSAALEGVEATKTYAAKFGRAKFLGDRSIGCQDAGATSVWLIFKAMKEWITIEGR